MRVKYLLAKHNIHLKKSLGQNLLIDKAALDRIVEAADLSKEDTVIEIGTGTGILTKELAKKARFVISFEKDKKILEAAKDYLSECDNVELINGDFLNSPLPLGERLGVVANLPYYITSPIIEKIFENKNLFSLAVLTVQREFAERIIAKPGTKDYSSFTIFVNYHSEPKIISYIPKSSFLPQPDVSSAIISLKIQKEPLVKVHDEKLFFEVVRAAFSQRRKTLRNALMTKFSAANVDSALLKAAVNPKRRGETLSIEEFACLANEFV